MKTDQYPELIETGKGTAEIHFQGAEVRLMPFQNGRYTYHRLIWKVGRKTFRRSFSDRAEAIKEGKRIVHDLARAEGSRTTVHSGDIVFLNECLRKVGGKTHMLSAIELYLRTHAIGSPRKTMGDLCDELEKETQLRKNNKEISHEHLKNIKYENVVLKKWFGSMTLHQITGELVKTKLLESDYSAVTKRNIIDALKAREFFARRKRYIPRDFESPLDDVPLPKIRPKTHPVFSPEELTRLFIVLRPSQLLYVATVCFGGGRCAEGWKLKYSDFLDEENLVCIDADAAKNPSRRTIDQTPNLQAWKAIAPKKEPDAPLISKHEAKKVYSDKARLREVGVTWKKNVLRHSFISYHLARHRDIRLTKELAGNSAGIIQSNYKALVTPSAAEAWFNITPISVRAYAAEKGLSHIIKW
jgi:hypothetical protein